jgi:hypothetical protein
MAETVDFEEGAGGFSSMSWRGMGALASLWSWTIMPRRQRRGAGGSVHVERRNRKPLQRLVRDNPCITAPRF